MNTPNDDGRARFERDDDLRARLRSGDRAARLRAVDVSHVARLLEAATSDPSMPAAGRRRGSSLLAAAAVVLVAGGGGLWAITGPHGDARPVVAADPPRGQSASPTSPGSVPPGLVGAAATTVLSVPDLATAKCMVPNVEVLARQDLAFEGTVTLVDGSVVSLRTDKVYTGEVAGEVQVQAPSEELGRLLSAVQFEVGKSYLVSASDGQVTLCGFSAEAGPELSALYDQAYAG